MKEVEQAVSNIYYIIKSLLDAMQLIIQLI